MDIKHTLSFLGRTFPVIMNKIKNPSERHLLRIGGERVAEMAGTFQVYYLKEAPEPLSSIDMECLSLLIR